MPRAQRLAPRVGALNRPLGVGQGGLQHIESGSRVREQQVDVIGMPGGAPVAVRGQPSGKRPPDGQPVEQPADLTERRTEGQRCGVVPGRRDESRDHRRGGRRRPLARGGAAGVPWPPGGRTPPRAMPVVRRRRGGSSRRRRAGSTGVLPGKRDSCAPLYHSGKWAGVIRHLPGRRPRVSRRRGDAPAGFKGFTGGARRRGGPARRATPGAGTPTGVSLARTARPEPAARRGLRDDCPCRGRVSHSAGIRPQDRLPSPIPQEDCKCEGSE